MQAFVYHWIYQDFWVPVWPNLAASLVVWTLMWLKMRSLRELHIQHHREHMQALERVGNGTLPQAD